MKNLLLASVGLVALGIGSASAADMPRRAAMPAKAPLYVSQMYNWTGAYIGINGGGAFSGSNGASGGLFGATLGYNYQAGSPLVWGLEGDLDWTRIRGSNTVNETSNRWLGTVRGRLGYAMGATGSVMPYITGGLAFGDINNSVPGFGSARDTKAGYALGAGIEAALSGPWTAKVEYMYVDLGNGPTVAGVGSNFHTNIIRAGLNYRF